MKKIRRYAWFFMILTIISLLSSVCFAYSDSAFSNLSNSCYAKVYTLSSSGTLIPYTTDTLSTRGTCSYGASRSSYIDCKTDELYLYKVGTTNGRMWALVSYPSGNRRVTAYIPFEYISNGNISGHAYAVSTGKFYCAKRIGEAKSSSYYVAKGDTVYRLSIVGELTQILYPISNGNFRIAYVETSILNYYCHFNTGNTLISESEIYRAAEIYGISKNTDAYRALESINTKYGAALASSANSPLVFLFEGVGNNSSAYKRMNAMCVVVNNGSITYINRSSSTIPDFPFDPSKNGYTDMPTVKSGIYDFTTCNHQGIYAALNISNAKVLRFSNQWNYYESTSYAINVHKRSSDTISSSRSWVNSAGCILIGKTDGSDYRDFIRAVGIVASNDNVQTYRYSVNGKIVIDRTYAKNYLSSVGYPASAISMLG